MYLKTILNSLESHNSFFDGEVRPEQPVPETRLVIRLEPLH